MQFAQILRSSSLEQVDVALAQAGCIIDGCLSVNAVRDLFSRYVLAGVHENRFFDTSVEYMKNATSTFVFFFRLRKKNLALQPEVARESPDPDPARIAANKRRAERRTVAEEGFDTLKRKRGREAAESPTRFAVGAFEPDHHVARVAERQMQVSSF